jgi:hypothetical protein
MPINSAACHHLMYRGVLPYVVVLTIALYVGLNASLWIIEILRLSMPFLVGLVVPHFFNTLIKTPTFRPSKEKRVPGSHLGILQGML